MFIAVLFTTAKRWTEYREKMGSLTWDGNVWEDTKEFEGVEFSDSDGPTQPEKIVFSPMAEDTSPPPSQPHAVSTYLSLPKGINSADLENFP